MNNVAKLAYRIRQAKGGGEEVKKATIVDGLQLVCNGRYYRYRLAVDIVTYPRKSVYVSILDSGTAVIVGD